MMAVVFRSRLSRDVDEDHANRSAEVFGYASKMPGFRSVKGYTAEDGESLTLVEFDPTDPLETQTKQAAHRQAQREWGDKLCSEYRVQVCEPVRPSESAPAEQ